MNRYNLFRNELLIAIVMAALPAVAGDVVPGSGWGFAAAFPLLVCRQRRGERQLGELCNLLL